MTINHTISIDVYNNIQPHLSERDIRIFIQFLISMMSTAKKLGACACCVVVIVAIVLIVGWQTAGWFKKTVSTTPVTTTQNPTTTSAPTTTGAPQTTAASVNTTSPPTTTAAPAVKQAILYEHANYGGKSFTISPGRYDFPAILAGIGNDVVSSAKVSAGSTLTLYENAGFAGRSTVLTADTPFLNTFNDMASSVILT